MLRPCVFKFRFKLMLLAIGLDSLKFLLNLDGPDLGAVCFLSEILLFIRNLN